MELCRSRVALLYASESPDPKAARMSNPVGITGSNPALALLRSARLGGQSGLLLQSVVGLFYGAMSRGLSRTPGAEMRAARAAAEDVGAEIVLGDRPVEITLRRAMGALGLGQRVSLVGMLARGAVTGPPEGFKEAMDEARAAGGGRAGGSGVLADLATVEGVPGGVASALLHERDLYLAWSMRRSKAVNGTRCLAMLAKERPVVGCFVVWTGVGVLHCALS